MLISAGPPKNVDARHKAGHDVSKNLESDLDCALDPTYDLRLGHRADLARGHLAVLEDHQRRDRHDPVLGRGLRVLIDIELYDLELALQFGRNLFEHGCDDAAGPAPFGPEIHEYGIGGLEHVGVEGRVGNLGDGHGLPREW